jgi:hypothetical protein
LKEPGTVAAKAAAGARHLHIRNYAYT